MSVEDGRIYAGSHRNNGMASDKKAIMPPLPLSGHLAATLTSLAM